MSIIEKLVGDCHVGDTDYEVCDAVINELLPDFWGACDPGYQAIFVWTVIECHHENQEIHHYMRGG